MISLSDYRTPRVELTHKPTGETVIVSADKSNWKNKILAMRILRSVLASGIGLFYNKIPIKHDRTYDIELSRIKDRRTGCETNDVAAVLDGGELDGFIEAGIRQRKS